MITKESDCGTKMAAIHRGTTLAWLPQRSVWLININVEIQGYGAKNVPEYSDTAGVGDAMRVASPRMQGFIEGFYDKD